mgnify:FL=1
MYQRHFAAVATVLTVYGIETKLGSRWIANNKLIVATVLTVYGIETNHRAFFALVAIQLQQYLPFTVLKHEHLRFIGGRCLTLSCNSTYRLRY